MEPCAANAHERAGRMRWAALLQRVFEIDALRCPRCGRAMRLIAAIEDPDVARRILECLKLPARAPPLEAAAAAPEQPQWLDAARMGRSLILAMRRRIRPCSSNSQFSFP